LCAEKSKTKKASKLEQARLRILELERELQHAKLDLDDAGVQLNAALHDLSLLNQQASDLKISEIRSKFGSLFQDLSAPLAQLLTQDYLQNVQGKSLNGKDVQATLQRLIRNLKKHGLEIVEEVGSSARFDSVKHEALDLDDTIKEGEDVLVRMCGIGFAGKVLRRASVSKIPKPE